MKLRDVVSGDILRRLTAGERRRDYVARLRCKDGSTRQVLITSSAEFDEAKNFLHTRCFTIEASTQRADAVADLRVEALCREVERLSWLAMREHGLVESPTAGFQAHSARPVEPGELLVVVASLAGRTG